MSVVQLAFQLLRLSPGAFPANLVQVFAASFTGSAAAHQVMPEINRGNGGRDWDDAAAACQLSPLVPPVNPGRDRDSFQRGYLMLLVEYSKLKVL